MTTGGADPQGYAGDVTPAEAWRLVGEDPAAVLVDVRTRPEWQFVGVPDLSSVGRRVRYVEWVGYPHGAPNPDFLDQLRADLPTERGPLLFLCRSGQRSIGAAVAATQAGLAPAYNILEGFEGPLDGQGRRGAAGWRAAGLPWCQS